MRSEAILDNPPSVKLSDSCGPVSETSRTAQLGPIRIAYLQSYEQITAFFFKLLSFVVIYYTVIDWVFVAALYWEFHIKLGKSVLFIISFIFIF